MSCLSSYSYITSHTTLFLDSTFLASAIPFLCLIFPSNITLYSSISLSISLYFFLFLCLSLILSSCLSPYLFRPLLSLDSSLTSTPRASLLTPFQFHLSFSILLHLIAPAVRASLISHSTRFLALPSCACFLSPSSSSLSVYVCVYLCDF